MGDGVPDGFVEAAVHGMISQELNLKPGGAEEGAHDPGNLGPHKKVADQPCQKCLGSMAGGGGEVAEVA